MSDAVKSDKVYQVNVSLKLMAKSLDDAKEALDAMPVEMLKAQLLQSLQRIPKGKSPSRADRLGEAEAAVEDAKSIAEELKDEISSWKESLPENLQNGDKASQLEECESALDQLISDMDNLDFSSIEFPGMY